MPLLSLLQNEGDDSAGLRPVGCSEDWKTQLVWSSARLWPGAGAGEPMGSLPSPSWPPVQGSLSPGFCLALVLLALPRPTLWNRGGSPSPSRAPAGPQLCPLRAWAASSAASAPPCPSGSAVWEQPLLSPEPAGAQGWPRSWLWVGWHPGTQPEWASWCVPVCAHVCLCVHPAAPAHMCFCTHTRAHTHTTHVDACLHTRMHVYMCACVCAVPPLASCGRQAC